MKVLPIIIIILLVISNLLVFISAQNSRIIGYQRGYETGHLDAIEGKYTRIGWELAGMVMDEAYLEASRTADMAHRQFLHDMIDQAIDQAHADGYGWATGRAKRCK